MLNKQIKRVENSENTELLEVIELYMIKNKIDSELYLIY